MEVMDLGGGQGGVGGMGRGYGASYRSTLIGLQLPVTKG